jgi:hypothetical protein
MTVVAVVVAAGVVLVMRFAPTPAPDTRSVAAFEETVPTHLGGGFEVGDVPAAVSAAVDVPVVAVRVLDEPPEGAESCHGMFGPADERQVEQVIATPDGLSFSIVGPEPSGAGWDMERVAPPVLEPGTDAAAEPEPLLWRESCTFARSGDRWVAQGSSAGPVEDFDMMGMSSGYSCCDEDGLATASAQLLPPGGATWALQERGAYWLAYPVVEGVGLQISWRFRESGFGPRVSSTHILWIDDEGLVLDDMYIDA